MCILFSTKQVVLEASNFKDNSFVATSTSEMLKAGFFIGAKVELTRRISIWFSKKDYHDVNVGECGWIKGEVGGEPVVNISKDIGKKSLSADVKVKMVNLKIAIDGPDGARANGTGAGADEGGAGGSKIPKVYKFVEDPDDDDPVEIVKGWEKHIATTSDETTLKSLHSALGFSLRNVLQTMPVYTGQDFLIIKRGSDPEVSYTYLAILILLGAASATQ